VCGVCKPLLFHGRHRFCNILNLKSILKTSERKAKHTHNLVFKLYQLPFQGAKRLPFTLIIEQSSCGTEDPVQNY